MEIEVEFKKGIKQDIIPPGEGSRPKCCLLTDSRFIILLRQEIYLYVLRLQVQFYFTQIKFIGVRHRK